MNINRKTESEQAMKIYLLTTCYDEMDQDSILKNGQLFHSVAGAKEAAQSEAGYLDEDAEELGWEVDINNKTLLAEIDDGMGCHSWLIREMEV